MGGDKVQFPRFPREPREAERLIDEELQGSLARGGEVEKPLDKSAREKKIQELISPHDTNNMEIAYLDVGQGDATVIRVPSGEIIVVDCNTANANVDIVDFLRTCGVQKIDYLIITHPHYDHMSGLERVADNFEIKHLIEPDVERTDITGDAKVQYDHYRDVVDSLERRGVSVQHPIARSDSFRQIGGANLYVYGPSRSALEGAEGVEKEVHTHSIVMKVQYGRFNMLFSGDIDQGGWERVSRYYDVKSTVLHASHHGSATGCDEECLKQISPSRTIISAGRGNPFGHPDSEAVNVYKKHSTNGIRTTKIGSLGISASKNGTYIFYD